ncbi:MULTISPECIES: grasp-with-spasm system SPASM domain peptide maturase [Chryseobacterium]|uniref:SPASM domain peptide maturase, grasp-with-spasm system n=1 Tax=Chryseobacterium taihuense TaxID=1141221 RepID=A0ABY0QQ66_9FLAO|nr:MULTISPECIES: grasp-with-spasm system SPASM domain peptide maturase [Chryseobacterium]SDL47551.1 SPASM domain peptide maturase, grasp-with-spasm system [Chryseobacterium taihuense]
MSKEVIKLYTNCIAVKGATQSIICDLHRNTFDVITNDLYQILKQFDGKKSINEIKAYYKNKYDDIIDEYFEFLFEQEYVFFTDTPKWYPKMNLEYDYPFEISNAILDRDINSNYDIFKAFDKLERLNCKFLEIRFYDKTYLKKLEKYLRYIEEKQYITYSIGFLLPCSKETTKENLEKLTGKHPRVSYLIITNSKENEFLPVTETEANIIYTKTNVDNEKCCGIITPEYFSSNIKLFTESLLYNSCLHKKIAIDKDGNIKNCPSMSQSFGNIKDTTLEQAVNQQDFKKYWNLTKDSIEVCKDCEFRYICTDCRAYTERIQGNADGLDTSKPLKCGYNPYTGEWEEWSTNPLKHKAMQFYKF